MSETSILVPVLNWQTSQLQTDRASIPREPLNISQKIQRVQRFLTPGEAPGANVISTSPSAAESAHTHVTVDGQCPLSASPGVPHLRFTRRASEASLASQVSGLADSYTASNIASSKCSSAVLCGDLALGRSADVSPRLISSLRTRPQRTSVRPAALKGPV